MGEREIIGRKEIIVWGASSLRNVSSATLTLKDYFRVACHSPSIGGSPQRTPWRN